MLNKKKYLLFFIIAIISFLAYWNALYSNFVWDDKALICSNSYIKSIDKLLVLLKMPFLYSPDEVRVEAEKYGYYRPLIILSLAIDYKIWHLNPFGYHLTNVIWNVLVCISIFYFVEKLFGNIFISFNSALLFALHPVHTESVTWISGRTDIIASFFYFSSICLYINFLTKPRYKPIFYLLSTLSFILALFSKEISVTLPIILILYEYSFQNKKFKLKFIFKKTAPFFILLFAYLYFRFFYLNIKLIPAPSTQFSKFVIIINFLTIALPYYISKLILPLSLSAYIKTNIINPDIFNILFAFIIIVFTIYIIYKSNKSNKKILFLLLFFICNILFVSNIIPILINEEIEFSIATRYLYLCSFSYCTIIIFGLFQFSEKYKNSIKTINIFLLLLYLAFIILTIIENHKWKNEEILFKTELSKTPESLLINNNLGNYYYDIQNFKETKKYLEKAYLLKSNDLVLYNNLSRLYYDEAEYDKAEKVIKDGLVHYPDDYNLKKGLALINFKKEKFEESKKIFEQLISKNNNDTEIYYYLGEIYISNNFIDTGLSYIEKYLPIVKDKGSVYLNIAKTLFNRNNYNNAILFLNKVIELAPENNEAYNMLGIIYKKIGNLNESESMYKKALKINPTDFNACNNLAIIFAKQNRVNEAIDYFEKALKIEPNNPQIYYNMSILYKKIGNLEKASEYLEKSKKF